MKKTIILSVLIIVICCLSPPSKVNYINTDNKIHIKNDDIKKYPVKPLEISTLCGIDIRAEREQIDAIRLKKAQEQAEKDRQLRYEQMQSKISYINNNLISDTQAWFVAYKNILYEYQDIIPYEEYTDNIYNAFSQYDIDVLQRIVEAEVTDGDFNSKVNVANVIFNRLRDKTFPKTIPEIVFQSGQFQPVSDGRYYSVEVTESTILAVEYAYMFEDTTYGAIYFESGESYVHSRYATYLFKDAVGHHFYK